MATIMRQQDRAQPRQKLDELGDSLVAMALRSPSDLDSGRFDGITGALIEAGARRGDGNPYAGALDRLIQIHQTYPRELLGRSLVVEKMLRLAEYDRAADYVFRVAISTDGGARNAMGALTNDLRTNGGFTGSTEAERDALRARLRVLWERANGEQPLPGGGSGHGTRKPSVPDARAYLNLQLFATEQGWPR